MLRGKKLNWLKDGLFLSLLIGLLFTLGLGTRPLNVPDEARYCEIAREMLTRHDFITPHINGIKYFEKPVLFYWMQAVALKLGGLSEWGCRFINAFMALMGCLAVYSAGRLLFDRKTGLLAAGILSTSFLYFTMARVVTLDMTLSVYLTLSLLSFLGGIYRGQGYYYFFFIFAACATLTKGLIGVIFPGAIVLLWSGFTRQCAWLFSPSFWKGSLVFLVLVLPWHIVVQIKNPEFFDFYFIDQQFRRYLTLASHRYEPNWYYLPIIFVGFYPWTGFLYGVFSSFFKKNGFFLMADNKNQREIFLFFMISAGLILAFFSFSKSKLVPYILPCFPFLALMIGVFLSKKIDTILQSGHSYFNNKKLYNYNNERIGLGFITQSLISTGFIIVVGTFFYEGSSKIILSPDAFPWLKLTAVILMAHAIAGPFLLYLFYKSDDKLKKKNFSLMMAGQFIFSALFLASASHTANAIYMGSIKPFAKALKKMSSQQDKIFTYDYYYHDLPFYLNREVTIVNWEGELTFGKIHTPNQNKMINDKTFRKSWDDPHEAVFVVLPRPLLSVFQNRFSERPFYLLSHTPNDALITNKNFIY